MQDVCKLCVVLAVLVTVPRVNALIDITTACCIAISAGSFVSRRSCNLRDLGDWVPIIEDAAAHIASEAGSIRIVILHSEWRGCRPDPSQFKCISFRFRPHPAFGKDLIK